MAAALIGWQPFFVLALIYYVLLFIKVKYRIKMKDFPVF